MRGACGAIVMVVWDGLGETSSNTELGCLHFT